MARVDINAVVSSIIRQNPNVSQDNLRVLVRENLEQMRSNGVKISSKQIAKANALVDEHFAQQAQIQFATRTSTPRTRKAVQQLNNQRANTLYNNSQNVAILTSNNPQSSMVKGNKTARRQALLDGMIDTSHTQAGTFEQYLDSLEAEGRIAERNAELARMQQVDASAHETSTTRKAGKKAAELQSQAEHKVSRPIKNKDLRDAHYATEHGIVRHKNKKYLNYVKRTCTGEGEIIPKLYSGKSAEASYRVFENAGLTIPNAAEIVSAQTRPATIGLQDFINARERINYMPKSAKQSFEVFEQAGKIAAETTEAAVAGAKQVGKFAKYGKAGMLLAVATGIGYTISELFGKDKKENIEERNNELKLTA